MANNTKIQGVAGGGPISQAEAKLLAAYRAAADSSRSDIILAAQAIARVHPRRHPALTLVQGTNACDHIPP